VLAFEDLPLDDRRFVFPARAAELPMRELLVQPRFNLGFSLADGSPDDDGRVTTEIGLEGTMTI